MVLGGGVCSMISGARLIYGSLEGDEHAKRMYIAIRKRKTDVDNIVRNTGFSREQIRIVKAYIFEIDHVMYKGIGRLDADLAIAESWRRLAEKNGRHILAHDILLLRHELYEIDLLIQNNKLSQQEAHLLATQAFNYQEESDRFYNII